MTIQTDNFDQYLSSVLNTLDTDAIYDAMMDAFTNILHVDGLLLCTNQQARNIYHVTRTYGDIAYRKKYCVFDRSVLNELRNRTLVHVDSNEFTLIKALLTPQKRAWLEIENISYMYVIKYNQAVIGFLCIADHTHRSLNEIEIKYLHKICQYVPNALRNANIFQKSYRTSLTDDLTSLYNRKHAFECIEAACLAMEPKTLMLFDIDDFKLYNELYGAKEGDNLIQHCAQALLQESSDGDICFRFGADEFMIMRNGTNAEDAKAFANRVIHRIIHSSTNSTVWNVTVTCGFSTFPVISSDAASLLHNTEQAVYYGKLDGKGNICHYQSGMEARSQNPDLKAAYDKVAPTIYALTAAIDAKDTYTFIHSMNVSKYAVILAEELRMNQNEIEIVRDAGLLHDIGKISIPERILQKTSRLTDEEYEIMKTHVENSTKMIRYLPDMDYVIPAVVGHHEHYDGKGYPRGLAGKDIPYMARILTIADCFDAMTARRPYKQPMSVSYAISELEKNSGTQFDPELVPVFVKLIYEGKISV